MRKVYFLLLLLCSSYALQAQVTTSICSGGTSASYSSTDFTDPGGMLYTWSAPSVVGISGTTGGVAASVFPGQTLTNSTTSPIDVTYNLLQTLPPFASRTIVITVNPTPTIGAIGNQIVCNGTLTAGVTFVGTVANTTFNWTNSLNVGLALTGSGDIASFTATNASPITVYANIVVTPVSNTCGGTSITFTYTVNPTPTVVLPTQQVLCNGISTTAATFSSSVANTHFDWVNSATSIGLAASSSGTINAFTATNAGNTPITALIVVTPVSNTCAGIAQTYTITVNPTPTFTSISDQVVCNGVLTSAITFSGPMANVTYNWANSTSGIGLAFPTGAGDIAAFTGVNNSNLPVTAFVTVTALSNSCSGTPSTFSITVNPTPTINSLADILVCNNANTSVTFSGSVANTTFNWTNNTPSIGILGTGTGNIAAFSATNSTNTMVSALLTVTPVSNTCAGASTSFSININPTPVLNIVTDQFLCAGTLTTPILFSSSVVNATYNWTSSTSSNGLPLSGSGNIGAFSGVNNSSAPLTAYVTVTPLSNTCSGTSYTFSITVNPVPVVDAISSQALCAGLTATIASFTSPTAGSTFTWTNNNTGIGLASIGTGDIAAFAATNSTNVAATALISVSAASNTCTSLTATFVITVNPTPTVDVVNDQVLCAGTLTSSINFSGTVTGTNYSWTNTAASIGIAFTGTGNIAAFAGTNASSVPATALLTVTPVSNTCSGASYTFSITVNPTPTVNTISPQAGCDNTTLAGVTFTGSLAGTLYAWTNNNTAIGLAAAGSATINAFSGTNGTNATTTGLITVTPISNTCAGTPFTFTYSVFPTPTVNGIADQIYCNGVSTTAVVFTGVVTGTTYNWTNTNIAIGLAAGSSGNIGSYTANNASSVPIGGIITVTPVSNTCTGTSTTFSVTVNPTPVMGAVSDQLVCDGLATSAVVFTSSAAGATFSWTNTTTSIGLASAGSGTIAAFTVTNGTGTPVSGVITVSALSNSCAGPAINFAIVANPVPVINSISQQVLCNGVLTTAVSFGLATTINNTVFNWTNNNTAIGLVAAGSSTSSITAFTATNASTVPVTADITVTAISNTCASLPTQFTITVNPTPTVNAIADQPVCDGALTSAVIFSGNMAGTVYNWTNTTTSIGLAAAGSSTASITAFTVTNNTSVPVSGVITVTPVSNTCTGATQTFVIIANPVPVINSISQQVLCNGVLTSAVSFGLATTINNTLFNWTNNNTAIGLASAGSSTSSIAAFTATNGSTVPVTADIIVTAISNTCSSLPAQFTITVNPTPTVNAISDQPVCDGSLTTAVIFSGNMAGTVYNWTNTTTSIGLTAAGSSTASITAFTVTNNTGVPVSGMITVTPVSNTCTGATQSFVIIANPVPVISSITSQAICNGTLTSAINFGLQTNITNTIFSWTNNNAAISLSLSGTGNIAAFTGTNGSTVPVTANVTVTAVSNTCASLPQQFTITVNPTPTVNSVASQGLCAGQLTTLVSFGGNLAGTVYNWTNTATAIGLAISGTGNIASFTGANNTNVPLLSMIVVTPISNTCTGATQQFTIVVNPVPVINGPADQVVCDGVLTTAINFSSPAPIANMVYNWTNSDPSIGLGLTSTGDIAAFTATNASNVPVVAVILLTGMSNACTSVAYQFSITVNPTPTVNTISNQLQCEGSVTALVSFSGNLPNTTYNWTNSVSAIGLAASGSGTINPFTTTNGTGVPLYASVTVTPFSNTCTGTATNFSIVVSPVPVVVLPSSLAFCNGTLNPGVTFTTSTSIANTTFSWTNNNISISLGASGTGNIAAFTATNPSNVPIEASITVTAISNTCSSIAQQFTITVNPTPTVNGISNQILCATSATAAITFTGNVANTVYDWTNTSAAIGPIALSGTGNIGVFTTTNVSNVPISALFVVTPFSNNCTGATTSFNIVVNPTPTVAGIADQFICNTLSASTVVFTGFVPNTSYQWTNTNPAVGLTPLSGTGNIAAFSATNAGGVPINSLVTVTPMSNSCSGTPTSFSYVVNPTPVMNGVTDQVLCNGVLTTAVSFSANLSNATYSWIQTNVAAGLTALSGTGPIGAFTATNPGNLPIGTVITVTPISNTCTGNFIVFSIVVNPTPSVNAIADQVVCNTISTTAVTFTGSVTNTTYTWSQTNAAAGLAALTGTGNIGSFIGTNPNPVPILTIITVQPVSNTCNGTAVSFSVLVNPTPTVSGINDQFLCTGVTTSVPFAGFLTNTVFTWTQTNAAIGLGAFSGTTSTAGIAAFSTTNTQAIPISSLITVTPSSNTCTGASTSFSITVNPMPTVTTVSSQALCNGVSSTAVIFSGFVANTTYQWVQTNVAIGLTPISGTTNIAAFAATNPTNVPIGSLITVTPISNTCNGAQMTFTIAVNPTPTLNPIGDQAICTGLLTTAVTFSGAISNTTYAWTQTNSAVGLAPFSGTGTIAAFTTTNATAIPINSLITVTPISNTCAGTGRTFSIVVNPVPTVNAIADQILCNGVTTAAVTFTGVMANTTYTWTNTNVAVGLTPLSGTGNIGTFTATNPTAVPINSQITVTPFSNTCTGTAYTFSYVVNPTPSVTPVSAQVLCNGISTTAVVFTGFLTNTTYSWVSTSIATGLTPLTGTGNIPGFTATNATGLPVSTAVTVTPFSNTCTGASTTFTYTVNPTPSITTIVDQAICNNFVNPAINITGLVTSATFSWTSSNSGVGLAALSGAGTIPSFTGTNAGTAPISTQINVTAMSNTCLGTPLAFTITVNPTPVLNSSLVPTAICNGSIFTYTATSATAGTTFLWNRGADADNTAASGAAGINETLKNTGTNALIEVYAYTLSANACSNAQTITVSITPSAYLSSTLAPTGICSGTVFSYIAASLTPGASFSWTRSFATGLSTGSPVSGNGNISHAISNSTTAPGVATYVYMVAASGCTNPQAFTVTFDVNPIPVLTSNTAPAPICSGVAFSYLATTATSGVSFAWSRLSATGISTAAPATGTGINVFQVLNNTGTSAAATGYAFTLTANGCTNTQTVPVTVYAVPVLSSSLTPAPVCSNALFSYTPTSLSGTTFTWTRPFITGITNVSNSGSNDPAETLISTSPLPVNVIYTYSIITAAGCNNAQTITLVVNPRPTLSTSLTPAAICSGTVFNYPAASVTPSTTFNWTRPVVSGISNGGATGFNNPFETLSNPGITPIAVSYNYTLTANGCTNPQVVTVFVNPIPVVGPQSATICSNSTFAITPTNVPATTLYTWAAPSVTPVGSTLGANAQSTGTTPVSQTLNNQTTNITTVVYSILPTASGCNGNTFTTTVTVNPTPSVGSQTMTSVCSGTPFNFIATGVPAGTTYTWAAPSLVPANGLSGGSAQPLSQPAVGQTLNSTNNVMDTAVYSVTPATTLCVGTPFLLSVPVKPVPILSNLRDTICSGNAFVLNPGPVPVNTTYTWTAPVIAPSGTITGGSSQSVPTTGISQTLTNNSTAYAQAAYTITPSSQNCAGPSFLLIETVNRSIPAFTAQNATICSGTAFNANPSNAPAGTLYTWPVPANPPPVGITGSSAVSVPVANVSQVLSNQNNIIDTVIYTVTPLVNTCPGTPFTAAIRVLPLPKATISGPTSVCANTIVDTVSIAFNGTGPWSFTYSDGITTNTKTGIAGTPYKLTMPPLAKNITRRTITVMNVQDASCSNTVDSSFFTQTINPLPVGKVISMHGVYMCNGIKDTLFIQSPDSLGYQWQINAVNLPGAITDSIATTTAGSYNALLTNKFGCTDTAAVPVSLFLIKPPVLKMTIDTACINSLTTFNNTTDTTFTGAVQWQWTFGNGSTANTMNASTTYQTAGNYHVSLKATQLSCSGYPPITLDSTVNIKSPIANVILPAVSAAKGDLTPVAGRNITGYKYRWVPSAGIQDPDSSSTLFNFATTQQYTIKLISPEGCVTNDSLLVRVFDADIKEIFVPKSFTPNGDGINDIMYPYIANLKQFHYFRVLNRYGKLLFESKTPDVGWNGTLNGTPQPMSIYFWFAEGIAADGTVVQKSGQFLLIR